MMETNLERAEANIRRNIEKKAKEEAELRAQGMTSSSSSAPTDAGKKSEAKKRGRWDATPQDSTRGKTICITDFFFLFLPLSSSFFFVVVVLLLVCKFLIHLCLNLRCTPM